MLAAYCNFRITERRKKIIADTHALRQRLFASGVGAQIVLADSNSEIGFGEEKALEASPALSDLAKLGMPDDGIRRLIAIAFTVLGPIGFVGVWTDLQKLSDLRKAYCQLQKICSEFMRNDPKPSSFS